MAGGEGAKERRRLKRLAALEEKNKPDDSQQRNISKEKNARNNTSGDHSNKRAPNYSVTKRRNPDGQKRFNKNDRHDRTLSKPKHDAKKKMKPKIKKPKHLKRKLEQASNETGEMKEVIEKEIEQFEARKNLYSKRNKNIKRQKTTDVDDSNCGNGDRFLPKLTDINQNLPPFPRSEKTEVKKPAVVEDNDIEMTDHKETTEAEAIIRKPFPKIEIKKPAVVEDNNIEMTVHKETTKAESMIRKTFPKIEIKKPTVVEDNNIEMTDHKETTKTKAMIRKDEPIMANIEPEEDSAVGSSGDEICGKDAEGKTPSQSVEHYSEVNLSQSSDDGDGSGGDSSNKSDDDSDDDTDDDEPIQQRQRGRRRRGRQDTAKQIEEMEAEEKSKSSTDSNGKTELKDINTINDKKRYCLGRKPVTDFVVGQVHLARVVYVKPFGVFFDIGCHSDAFCHVSRLSDDFVESPESMFKEGDEVPKVRIVEIDRRQKRITVSLQSDTRIEDERKSMEARKSRKEKKKNKPKKKAPNIDSSGHDSTENYSRVSIKPSFVSNEPAVKRVDPAPMKKNLDPSMMTPADLKRARKLARRAERRAQVEQQP